MEPTPELLTDYRELRAVFLRARLFRSSKVYYTLKTLTNLSLLAGSIAVIRVNQSMLGIMLSAMLMATCFQQCGWLSHDFLHHQVLPYPLQHQTMPMFSMSYVFLVSDLEVVCPRVKITLFGIHLRLVNDLYS